MVYASFLLLILQPDLPAVLIQKKVVRTAEGDLRSLALSLFEGYQERSLPDSDAMKAGGIYLSSSFVFVLSFFSSYLDQNFHMKETSLSFIGG